MRAGRMQHGVYVLEPNVEFDYVDAPTVRKELQAGREAGATAIVFDLSGVSFMDSAGLRVVVDALREFGRERVALAAAHDHVLRLLSTVGLEERLQLFPTLEDALAVLARHSG